MNKTFLNVLYELWILVFTAVLFGAFTYQIELHHEPCPLCMLQRGGMIAAAFAPLLNRMYGTKHTHFGVGMLGSIFGLLVSSRQILLNVCSPVPYEEPVFGLQLFTWAYIVQICSLVATAVFLFIAEEDSEPKPLNRISWTIFGLLGFVTFANIITSYIRLVG